MGVGCEESSEYPAPMGWADLGCEAGGTVSVGCGWRVVGGGMGRERGRDEEGPAWRVAARCLPLGKGLICPALAGRRVRDVALAQGALVRCAFAGMRGDAWRARGSR